MHYQTVHYCIPTSRGLAKSFHEGFLVQFFWCVCDRHGFVGICTSTYLETLTVSLHKGRDACDLDEARIKNRISRSVDVFFYFNTILPWLWHHQTHWVWRVPTHTTYPPNHCHVTVIRKFWCVLVFESRDETIRMLAQIKNISPKCLPSWSCRSLMKQAKSVVASIPLEYNVCAANNMRAFFNHQSIFPTYIVS